VWIRQSHDGLRHLIMCVLRVAQSHGVPLRGIKSNLTPWYFGPFVFLSFMDQLCTKFETFPFLLILSGVSCLSTQNLFMSIHHMSWPWDTWSSHSSIISELLSFSFVAAERNSWRKKIKLFLMTSRINLFKKEDRHVLWRLLKTVVTPSLFSYLGISGSRFL
jgi:hypothetical protein